MPFSGSKLLPGEKPNWLERASEDLVGDGEPCFSGDGGSGTPAADLVGLLKLMFDWLSLRLWPLLRSGEEPAMELRSGLFSFLKLSKRAKVLASKSWLIGLLALGRSTMGSVVGS